MPTRTLLLLILIAFNLCVLAAQSGREYVDKTDHYRITLFSDWQPFVYTDSLGRQKTEFVFRDRDQGLLKITREDLAGQSLANKVHSDLEEMRLRVACSYSGQEVFRGDRLSGIRVALHFFEDDHRLRGTTYYLQDGESVWILRFTAKEGAPGLAGDLTGKMARSFCSVCPIP